MVEKMKNYFTLTKYSKQSGVTLITTLFFLVILTSMAIHGLTNTSNMINMSTNTFERKTAMTQAEGNLKDMLMQEI